MSGSLILTLPANSPDLNRGHAIRQSRCFEAFNFDKCGQSADPLCSLIPNA